MKVILLACLGFFHGAVLLPGAFFATKPLAILITRGSKKTGANQGLVTLVLFVSLILLGYLVIGLVLGYLGNSGNELSQASGKIVVLWSFIGLISFILVNGFITKKYNKKTK